MKSSLRGTSDVAHWGERTLHSASTRPTLQTGMRSTESLRSNLLRRSIALISDHASDSKRPAGDTIMHRQRFDVNPCRTKSASGPNSKGVSTKTASAVNARSQRVARGEPQIPAPAHTRSHTLTHAHTRSHTLTHAHGKPQSQAGTPVSPPVDTDRTS
ncbi:hypothetical protein SV7mr_24740 [Stieleria bergensis]|uniref:Uncharacterized protein n=1 Tax=Stieleria bergensis TaxID=2528025 RepID=A0A517SV23_9BACT|nr:hypothetical protein SV7mr_24740 [Planctomycetes bacterium SV_7m_r]